MKVLMLNPAFSGGLYTHELCEALGARGCEVELFTGPHYGQVIGAPGGRSYRVRTAFYRFTQLKSYQRDWSRPLWRVARLAGHLWAMARTAVAARRFDIVHVQFLPLPALDLWWLRWVAKGSCVVYTVHDLYPHDARSTPTLRRRLGRAYRASARLVAHTRFTSEQLVNEFGIPPERIAIIPHGAIVPLLRPGDDAAADPPAELQGAEPIILLFGQLRPGKGLDVLIRAAALLRDEGVPFRLVAAGESADPQPYRRLVQDLGLESMVHLRAERIPEGEVRAYFATAAVVALPYRVIDQSGVAVMALSFGRALVASNLAGLGELVGAADCGLLVPPEDPPSLAAALKRLLGDEALRRRYEANSLRYAKAALDWSVIAGQTIAVYRAAVRGGRA